MLCPVCLRRVDGPRCRRHPHEVPVDATLPEVAPWVETLWEQRNRRQLHRAAWAAGLFGIVLVPLVLVVTIAAPFLPTRLTLGLLAGGPRAVAARWLGRRRETFDDWLERTLSS
ncbi:MAG: hypothetical protein ABMA64_33495 [Myxococcota bacterium]